MMNWIMINTVLYPGPVKKIKPLNSSSLTGRQSPNSSAWYQSLTTRFYKAPAHFSNLALNIPTPCLPPHLPPPKPIHFSHGSWPLCPFAVPIDSWGSTLSSRSLWSLPERNPPSSPYWLYNAFLARFTPLTGLGFTGSVCKTSSQGTVWLGPSSSGNRLKNLSSPLPFTRLQERVRTQSRFPKDA